MAADREITIVVVGTLDTKGLEIGYLKDEIIARGCVPLIIDAGVLGRPQTEPDIGREQIARLSGTDMESLRRMAEERSDRMEIIEIMIKGLKKAVGELYDAGRLDGIISVGGSMGMAIGVSAMKVLPVGTPKVMVGTHFYPQYLGESDLTIMQSPSDIMGLNPITNLTLSQAAGAVCAMAEAKGHAEKARPLVAMTALGVTTPAVMSVQGLLRERDLDSVVFHGNSTVMDELVERDIIDGILDFSPNELIRIFVIEETPWREERLEIAGRKGLPQVFVPGSLDMIVLRVARDQIPDQYEDRKIYMHGPYITGVRTSKEEMKILGKIVSDKLNRSKGRSAVVFPLRGFSAIDRKGFAFFDPETDRVLLEELKANLKEGIDVVEVDAHIFDDEFVKSVVDVYGRIAKGR